MPGYSPPAALEREGRAGVDSLAQLSAEGASQMPAEPLGQEGEMSQLQVLKEDSALASPGHQATEQTSGASHDKEYRLHRSSSEK